MLKTATGRVMALLIGLALLWGCVAGYVVKSDIAFYKAEYGPKFFWGIKGAEVSRWIIAAVAPLILTLALTWALRPVWRR